MAYTIENRDIVISGWEEGIFDDPYKGIYDMRNCDNITIPGEVSVAMKTQSTYTYVNLTSVEFTVDNTTETFTWAGGTTLPVNTAIKFTNSGGALPAGLTSTTTYYIKTTGATTFTITLKAGGTTHDITDDGSGTNYFTVVNMEEPVDIIRATSGNNSYYFLSDTTGRIWIYDNLAATNTQKWIYTNNLATTDGFTAHHRIVFWRDYLFALSSNGTDYISFSTTLANMTDYTKWTRAWKNDNGGGNYSMAIVGQDDIVYFCSGAYVGSLLENEGSTFDPTDANTYTWNAQRLDILGTDRAISLAELGNSLLIGGTVNIIYPWDKISDDYDAVIYLSENFTSKMITINNTTYIFAGTKGRIFITNGGNAMPFWKIPEYLSDTTNPYILWRGVGFNRNQLYFSFSLTDNSGIPISRAGGLWAVNVDSSQPTYPRLQNQLSFGTYSGYVSAICTNLGSNLYTQPSSDGYGLWLGWSSASSSWSASLTYPAGVYVSYAGYVYLSLQANNYNNTPDSYPAYWELTSIQPSGVDKGISTPYTAGEPYVITDLINVGQFKTKRTFENIEFKLGAPLVTGESLAISYRTDLNSAFVDVPITSGNSAGDLSGLTDTVNFENAQWVQLKATFTGTSTTPSYIRLREIRLR